MSGLERVRVKRRGPGGVAATAAWWAIGAAVCCGWMLPVAGQANMNTSAINQRSPWNKKADHVCMPGDLNSSWTEVTPAAAWPGIILYTYIRTCMPAYIHT